MKLIKGANARLAGAETWTPDAMQGELAKEYKKNLY
jgi:hypothetical protein